MLAREASGAAQEFRGVAIFAVLRQAYDLTDDEHSTAARVCSRSAPGPPPTRVTCPVQDVAAAVPASARCETFVTRLSQGVPLDEMFRP